MTDPIEAILFDMGGTLRSSVPKDENSRVEMAARMIELLGADFSAQEFARLLSARSKAYSRWARETLIELNERDLWIRWMLPDWPADQIRDKAIQLNQLWREATGERIVFPETKEVILELFRRGYRLGLVSNTISSTETPRALEALELTGCFETVILSCVVGMRKPDPAILLEATRRMGVKPENCVYIGDRLNRDVTASRKAGFSQVIIRRDPETFAAHQAKYPELVADRTIGNLKELLDIFPARSPIPPSGLVYDVSLSTMWMKKNFSSLADFFEAARRMGFSSVELNHQMDSALLSDVDFNRQRISSIHEPCPADISTEALKDRDWLVSSPDEDHRKQGVEAIKRSLDLAHQIGVDVIVVHAGMVSTDLSLEKKLRKLSDAGQTDSDEYQELKQKLIETRAGLAGPRFEAVRKSLTELLEYAHPFRIRLGLENRYHYFDIPIPEELDTLLALAGPEQLGFIYDVGHAQTLDRLGFFPHEDWLRRFSARMIGTHLHDVRGVVDHYAPGLGDVDFDRIAPYLPAEAFRTCEFQVINSPEQVRAGLKFLYEHGCINSL